ncbi:MAG: hypothetical protein HKM06_09180 [Spirochaetales bacterium]|nr:hypothetical protein [Spirochaetales bacterium]
MKFKFRLEKVLELRRWEEKQAELALAAKAGECQNLQNKILVLRNEKTESFRRRRTDDPLSVFLAVEAFGARLQKQADELEDVLMKKLVERDELQKIFLAAQTKRKVLDKLQEKRHAEFKKNQAQLEFKRQDDLNTAAFVRKIAAREAFLG